MKELERNELDRIYGGETISGTVFNAAVNLIKIIKEAGYDLGSGIRRLSEDNVCPLE